MTSHHHAHDSIFELSAHQIHALCDFVNLLGIGILLIAIGFSMINITLAALNNLLGTEYKMIFGGSKRDRSKPASFARTRFQLGSVVALGLEVLVVADVLETMTKDVEEFSWDGLGKLGAVAAFRTLLAIALGREVKEIEEEIDAEDEANEKEEKKKEKKHKKEKEVKEKDTHHAHKKD